MIENTDSNSHQNAALEDDSLQSRWYSIWPHLRSAMTVVVFVAAFWLLHHEFSTLNFRDVAGSFRSMPLTAILKALALTMANYVVMIGYDAIAMRMIGHRVSAVIE